MVKMTEGIADPEVTARTRRTLRTRKVMVWGGIAVGAPLLAVTVLVVGEAWAFDRSVEKTYTVAFPQIARSTDPDVIARGRHIVESFGECIGCHGADLGGGKTEPLGPMGTVVVPNVTAGDGGRLAGYTDPELARLLRHGIKRDGRTVRLMPVQDFAWWPDEDVQAVISYLRTVPPVDGNPGVIEFSAMGKVLDRFDSVPIDVARRIDHRHRPTVPPQGPTAEYGAFLGTSCRGCHGATLAGGPIPGAPPDLPVPLNLTAHPTGLANWTYTDFVALLDTGIRKDGRKLDPFMPVASLARLSEVEKRALWAYLRSVPPRPLGAR